MSYELFVVCGNVDITIKPYIVKGRNVISLYVGDLSLGNFRIHRTKTHSTYEFNGEDLHTSFFQDALRKVLLSKGYISE